MRRCGRPVSTPVVAPLLLSALLAGCAGSASDSNAGSDGPSQQVAPSSSTSSPDSRPAPGDHRPSFSIDATERTARLHAPPGYAGTTAMRGGIKLWQDRLKCRPGAAQPLAAGAVRKTSAPCADRSEVEVYQVKDGGHAWFGASTGDLADTDPKINATDVIWDFFAAHPRPN